MFIELNRREVDKKDEFMKGEFKEKTDNKGDRGEKKGLKRYFCIPTHDFFLLFFVDINKITIQNCYGKSLKTAPAGLEPAILRVEIFCIIQLCYEAIIS